MRTSHHNDNKVLFHADNESWCLLASETLPLSSSQRFMEVLSSMEEISAVVALLNLICVWLPTRLVALALKWDGLSLSSTSWAKFMA